MSTLRGIFGSGRPKIDWHVVRALSALAALEHEGSSPAFSDGTSLLKGWGLIKRFSEDIDFKVAMAPGASGAQERKRRSEFRKQVPAALCVSDSR